MYRIEKAEGKITVFDSDDKLVYNAPAKSYLVSKSPNPELFQVQLIEKLSDQQLLTALANSVRLPMDKG